MISLIPNVVTQLKTAEKDGYGAVQIGTGEKKSVRKPQLGHLKKAGIEKKVRFLREVKIEAEDLQPGQEILLNQVFSIGDAVKVTGVSKGRGFAGGVKRHGFHGGPKTHGQSDRHRAPGSIGSGTTPGRVLKGKKMAGHMGVATVTYKGLEVIGIDKEKNILTIKGGVPGPIGALIRVENIGRIKGYIAPPEEKPSEEEEAEVVATHPSEGGKEENSGNENQVVVDDSAVQPESTGQAESESSNQEGEQNA